MRMAEILAKKSIDYSERFLRSAFGQRYETAEDIFLKNSMIFYD